MINKFLIYIHQERAGGTTLNNLVQYNLPLFTTIRPKYWTNEKINDFTPYNLKKLIRIAPQIQGIGSHLLRGFYDYKEVINKEAFIFTFLREPISRYMSHFNYQRIAMNINWNIQDFLNEKRFNNYQTVKIAGKEDIVFAKDILSKDIDFVGISKYYNESLIYLSKKTGISVNYQLRNALNDDRRIIKYESLTKEQQEKIMSNNALDIKLYNFALQELFNNYRKEYVGDINKQLSDLEKENSQFRYSFLKRLLIKFYKGISFYIIQPLLRVC